MSYIQDGRVVQMEDTVKRNGGIHLENLKEARRQY
jgi:hypothetical protein